MRSHFRTRTILATLALWALVAPIAHAAEPEESAFDGILVHYEAIWQALTQDTFDGVTEHGGAIQQIVSDLEGDFSAERAGVAADAAGEVEALLPELATAAESLSASDSLEAARDAFYDLSKPLVRYRKAATGQRPVVAYCSMAKRSWLQPEGEIGNPYYGSAMLTCGEVVDG